MLHTQHAWSWVAVNNQGPICSLDCGKPCASGQWWPLAEGPAVPMVNEGLSPLAGNGGTGVVAAATGPAVARAMSALS